MPIVRPREEDEFNTTPMSVVQPAPGEGVWDTVKKYSPTPEEIARFGITGAGMVTGGAAGAAAPMPGGTIVGGALGYAGGQQAADLILGERRKPKENETVAQAAWEETKQAGVDTGEGIVMALLDPLFRITGKGLYALESGARSIKGKGVKGVISDYADKQIKKSAANKLTEATSRGDIERQVGKNLLESERIEGEMPGVKFTAGERTGDPNLLSLERVKGAQPGYGAASKAEFEMTRNEAVRNYVKDKITGRGEVSNFLSAVEGEKGKLADITKTTRRRTDIMATMTEGVGEQEAGAGILEKARAKRIASSIKAEELYNKVPDELEIESQPLWEKVKEMFGSYDELTQRVTATPTKPMGRVQEAMAKGGEEKLPETLKEAKGMGLLDAQGNFMMTGAEEVPRNLTMKEMRDFRSQISTAQRVARAAKDDELAWKYGELKRSVNQCLKDTADKGGEGAIVTIRGTKDDLAGILQLDAEEVGAMSNKQIMNAVKEAEEYNYSSLADGVKVEVKIDESATNGLNVNISGSRNTLLDILQARGEMKEAPDKALVNALVEAETTNLSSLSNVEKVTSSVVKSNKEGVEALKKATDYYANIHVPTFKHGSTGRILARTSTGEQRVLDSSVGGVYFKSGKGAVEAADDFVRTFGNDPEAKSLIRDYAAQSLLRASRNTVTGDISSKAIRRWQYQHQEALKRLGLWGELGTKRTDMEAAAMLMDRAREAEASFNKNAIARALDADPDRYVESVLMTGTGKKQSIGRLKAMVNIAKNSKDAGAAMDGLRAAIGQYFERSTAVTATDLARGDLQSYHKVHKFWNDMRGAMKESGLYNKEQMDAWDNVHKALQTISTKARPASPKDIGVSEMIGKTLAGASSIATHRLGTYGVVRHAYSMVGKMFKEEVDQVLIKALYDPRYAEELMRFVNNSAKIGAEKSIRSMLLRTGRLDEAIGRTPGLAGVGMNIRSKRGYGGYGSEGGGIMRPGEED